MTRDFNISTRVYNYWCEMRPHVKAIIIILIIVIMIMLIRRIIIRRIIIRIEIIVELIIKLKRRKRQKN